MTTERERIHAVFQLKKGRTRVRQDPLRSSNPLQKDRFKSLTTTKTVGTFEVRLTGEVSGLSPAFFPEIDSGVQRVRPATSSSQQRGSSPPPFSPRQRRSSCLPPAARKPASDGGHFQTTRVVIQEEPSLPLHIYKENHPSPCVFTRRTIPPLVYLLGEPSLTALCLAGAALGDPRVGALRDARLQVRRHGTRPW